MDDMTPQQKSWHDMEVAHARMDLAEELGAALLAAVMFAVYLKWHSWWLTGVAGAVVYWVAIRPHQKTYERHFDRQIEPGE